MPNYQKNSNSTVKRDEAILPVPIKQRGHWIGPTLVNAGLEFSIPILTTGALIVTNFNIWKSTIIIFIGVFITWIGNFLNSYMGAKTGRSSTVIARSSFGRIQARLVVGINIMIVSLFWWSLQTHVASEAISAMIGINKDDGIIWYLLVILIGLTFAIPSILGYESMKWTDYLAVPAGLLLVAFGVYLALQNTGWNEIKSWDPTPTITVSMAISFIISTNISQWIGSADYTRYAKPLIKDNIIIPLGVIGLGFFLFLFGAFIAAGGEEPDVVEVMVNLNFPIWGFLVLYLATWTSQLVNNYSMGLAMSNMFNINSGKGRAWLTFLGTIIGIFLAFTDIMTQFENFLNVIGLTTPPVAAIMMVDYFIIRKQKFEDINSWNWVATITMIFGFIIGYFTQYVYYIGMPLIQSFLITATLYYLGMYIKSKKNPDQFTKILTQKNN